MTPQDIHEIENAFSITLPISYVQAVCPYPFPADSSLANYALLESKDWLLQVNQELRTKGWKAADWPPHFFVIGFDGGDCYYFLDLSRNNTEVLIISKEGCEIDDAEVYAPSLAEFVDDELAADDELDDADESPQRIKDWWELF